MATVTMTGYIAKSTVAKLYLQKNGRYESYPEIFETMPTARKNLQIIECKLVFKPFTWLPVDLRDLVDSQDDANTIVKTVLELQAEGVIRLNGDKWEKLQ